jgi:uncharacterized protein (TIGR00725 family)
MPIAAVFGSARIADGDTEYAVAMRMGELLAGAGWAVMTGGYAGAMEAASRGAREAGGHVVGVTVAAWSGHNRPNAWVAEERPRPNLISRLEELMSADAAIAVGGGIGTLAEVALAWNLRQKGAHEAGPLILVGAEWANVVPQLARSLVIDHVDVAIANLVADPDAAMALLAPPR